MAGEAEDEDGEEELWVGEMGGQLCRLMFADGGYGRRGQEREERTWRPRRARLGIDGMMWWLLSNKACRATKGEVST